MTTAHHVRWSRFQPGQERIDVRAVMREPLWKRPIAVILALVGVLYLVGATLAGC